MKRIKLLLVLTLASSITFAQETENPSDTTKMKLKNKEIIIIDIEKEDRVVVKNGDTIKKKKKSEAHWAGVDFGFSMLMNDQFATDFSDYPYWENDAARSQVWNLNFAEYKFNFGTPYVGLTTGLGFSFTSLAFKDNYVLQSNADTLFATIDTVYSYTKNKLKATYLTMPLLLEFIRNVN